MKYKYNITYVEEGKKQTINFNRKESMIVYLIKNGKELSKLKQTRANFKSVSLPLKDTIWYNK